VVELIDLYLENAARQVSEIKGAVEAKKPQLLKQTAHALKGGSLTMGARRVGGICEQIEHEQIDSSVLVDLLTKLESAFASTSDIFRIERQNRSVPVAA
jgi:HPt (histidine-containing phosphotransfer) domain-containing protein